MLRSGPLWKRPPIYIAVAAESTAEFQTWVDEQHPGATVSSSIDDGTISATGRPTFSYQLGSWIVYGVGFSPNTAEAWFGHAQGLNEDLHDGLVDYPDEWLSRDDFRKPVA